jgi:hypothetical protein
MKRAMAGCGKCRLRRPAILNTPCTVAGAVSFRRVERRQAGVSKTAMAVTEIAKRMERGEDSPRSIRLSDQTAYRSIGKAPYHTVTLL